MVKLGKYEFVLMMALEQLGPGPWNRRDLDEARAVLTRDVCFAVDRECDSDAVHDWLVTLEPREVGELLERLNASRIDETSEAHRPA